MADTTTTAETGTTTSPRTASTLPLNLEQDAEDKVPITPSVRSHIYVPPCISGVAKTDVYPGHAERRGRELGEPGR